MQNINVLRPAVAGDQTEGIKRDGSASAVFHAIGDREHIIPVDGDRALESQTLPVVPRFVTAGLSGVSFLLSVRQTVPASGTGAPPSSQPNSA